MRMSGPLIAWATLTVTVAGLSLGLSFAHVLEAPPRLTVWSAELWRETTVFNGQFRLFAPAGAVLDVGSKLMKASRISSFQNSREPEEAPREIGVPDTTNSSGKSGSKETAHHPVGVCPPAGPFSSRL